LAKKKTISASGKSRSINGQAAMDRVVLRICDVMRRSNCAGALQYVPELTWLMFLRILDEREEQEAEAAKIVGADFRFSMSKPYRWQDWAAPEAPERVKRMEQTSGKFFDFVNGELIPHLKKLKDQPNATPRQKVISEIMSGVDRTRVDTERNLCDVLDKVDEINSSAVDATHVFTLSQVYEGLLLKMGEKGNDGGQFFTPREVIRAMVEVLNPKVGQTVYDPCCGTGGFLAQAFEWMHAQLGPQATGDQINTLKHRTFYGREKENLIYPIALANLILHGIDEPHLWHGNTLTQSAIYAGLYEQAPSQFDVILTNPPFGGKEGKDAQTRFPFKCRATQLLFLQDVMASLKNGGNCGIVLDEGVLFQTNQDAFVKTKRRLLDTCNLWCIVSLPPGLFTAAGAGVKTNLLFFTKGQATEKIWYYDLADVKVGKKKPFTRANLEGFFECLPDRKDSERSWTLDIASIRKQAQEEAAKVRATSAKPKENLAHLKEDLSKLKKSKASKEELDVAKVAIREKEKEIKAIENRAQTIEDAAFDLKAVNPNSKVEEDARSSGELIEFIETSSVEIG